MVLWWPSTKIVQIIFDWLKNMATKGGMAKFCYVNIGKTLNETTRPSKLGGQQAVDFYQWLSFLLYGRSLECFPKQTVILRISDPG